MRVLPAICFLLLWPLSASCADAASALPTIAIAQLEARKIDSLDVRTLSDALADQLLKTREVRVMERSQMNAILAEQGFQQTGACDGQECAVQIGRILGINRIIVGSVAGFGKAITVSVRAVDVETGEVVSTASRTWKGDFEDLLIEIIPQIARDLTHPTDSASIADASPSIPPINQEESASAVSPASQNRKSPDYGSFAVGAFGFILIMGITGYLTYLSNAPSN